MFGVKKFLWMSRLMLFPIWRLCLQLFLIFVQFQLEIRCKSRWFAINHQLTHAAFCDAYFREKIFLDCHWLFIVESCISNKLPCGVQWISIWAAFRRLWFADSAIIVNEIQLYWSPIRIQFFRSFQCYRHSSWLYELQLRLDEISSI